MLRVTAAATAEHDVSDGAEQVRENTPTRTAPTAFEGNPGYSGAKAHRATKPPCYKLGLVSRCTPHTATPYITGVLGRLWDGHCMDIPMQIDTCRHIWFMAILFYFHAALALHLVTALA